MGKYVDAITASKEEAAKSLAPARAKEQEAALGIEVAQLDLEVQTQQNRLAELTSAYPLNFDAIIEAQDEYALNARRLEQLKKLGTDLFGS